MILDVEQELHMPAERLDARGEPARHRKRQPGPGGAVDTEAAHAAVRQIAQRAVGDVLADQRDAAQPVGMRLDDVDDEAVVVAVEPGLHQHAALEAGCAQHCQIIVERDRRRRVQPVGGPRIFIAGAEHVAVAVGGLRRKFQLGLADFEVRTGAHRRIVCRVGHFNCGR